MKCPFDGTPACVPSITCANCGRAFTAVDAGEVGKVDFLLSEIDTWGELLPVGLLNQLRRRYAERRDVMLSHIQSVSPATTDRFPPET